MYKNFVFKHLSLPKIKNDPFQIRFLITSQKTFNTSHNAEKMALKTQINKTSVNAFFLSVNLDIASISKFLTERNLLIEEKKNYLQVKSQEKSNAFQTFFFKNGSVVHWGRLEKRQTDLFKKIKRESNENLVFEEDTSVLCGLSHDFNVVIGDFPSNLYDKLKTEIEGPSLYRIPIYKYFDFNGNAKNIKLRVCSEIMRFKDVIAIPSSEESDPFKVPSEVLGVSLALAHSARLDFFDRNLRGIMKNLEKHLGNRSFKDFLFCAFKVQLRQIQKKFDLLQIAFDKNYDAELLWDKFETEKWFLEVDRFLDRPKRLERFLRLRDSTAGLLGKLDDQWNTCTGFLLETGILIVIAADFVLFMLIKIK